MTPEARVETYLRKQARKAGGMCVKVVPTRAGIPDRMVILPPGVVYLVELKQPKGALREIQKVMHAKLAKIGHEVAVLYTKEAVDEWLDSVASHAVE